MSITASTWALGLLAGLATGQLEAPEKSARVAVVPVMVGDPGSLSVSTLVGEVGEAASLRRGLSVLTMEDLFVAGGDTALAAVRACGSDLSCVGTRVRQVGADSGLLIVVNFAMDAPLLSLRFFDVESEEILAVRSESSPRDSVQISERIRAMAEEVFEDAGYPKAARLTVQVEPPAASVSVGKRKSPDPGTSNVYTLQPGTYDVRAALEGYSPAEQSIDLTSGEERMLEMSLEEDTKLYKSPWFWVIVGVVASGAAAATTVALTSGSDEYCFCVEGAEGGCEGC